MTDEPRQEPVLAQAVGSGPSQSGLSQTDLDHLHILSVLHYVMAGLALLGMGLLACHYLFFQFAISSGAMRVNGKQVPLDMVEMFQFFRWFYVLGGVMLLTMSLANFLSGRFLQRRRHRTFSFVVASLDLLQAPLGTTLGVFTFLVLSRESVRLAYEAAARADARNSRE